MFLTPDPLFCSAFLLEVELMGLSARYPLACGFEYLLKNMMKIPKSLPKIAGRLVYSRMYINLIDLN